MAIDPSDPVIVAILARLDAVEADVADLKRVARAKLVEHLQDHTAAGYDFRDYVTHRGAGGAQERRGQPESP